MHQKNVVSGIGLLFKGLQNSVSFPFARPALKGNPFRMTQNFEYPLLFCVMLLLSNCTTAKKTMLNPPAPGFDVQHSDQKAIAIADEVMAAMGGRQAWDDTRYFHWNFFGSRTLDWDKQLGRVRIDSEKDRFRAIINLHDNTGKIEKNGQLLTHPDSITFYLQKAKSIWINDSYWLVMPFKLKDSGVTLKYVGERNTKEGQSADVLSLTFKGVGDTPDNKYEVYVDKQSRLITQWDFFVESGDQEPRFSTPWANYQKYGKILLSGDRGGDYRLTQLSVAPIEAARFERF
jgi:plasmid maintenance system killer protein